MRLRITKICILFLIGLLSYEFVDSSRFSPIEIDEDSYISFGMDDTDDGSNTFDDLFNDLIISDSYSVHFSSTFLTSQHQKLAIYFEFLQTRELYIWFKQLRIFHL